MAAALQIEPIHQVLIPLRTGTGIQIYWSLWQIHSDTVAKLSDKEQEMPVMAASCAPDWYEALLRNPEIAPIHAEFRKRHGMADFETADTTFRVDDTIPAGTARFYPLAAGVDPKQRGVGIYLRRELLTIATMDELSAELTHPIREKSHH